MLTVTRNKWPWQERRRVWSNHMRDGKPWPRLTVITPSFNQGRFIEETIRSVLQQGYPNLEYIIVDGGSTDNTLEILRKYEDRLAYWVSEPDRGQSHALNKGLSRATGDIIGWLNSDDMYTDGCFRKVVEAFAGEPDAVLLHGNRILLDENSQVSGWARLPAFDPERTGYVIASETAFWRRAATADLEFKEHLHFAMDQEFFGRLYHVGKLLKLDAFLWGTSDAMPQTRVPRYGQFAEMRPKRHGSRTSGRPTPDGKILVREGSLNRYFLWCNIPG